MEPIQAYYDGNVFVPLVPVKAAPNQPALITLLDTKNTKAWDNYAGEFFGALSEEGYTDIAAALKEADGAPKSKPVYGSGKGKMWISEDFDAPLEELREYME